MIAWTEEDAKFLKSCRISVTGKEVKELNSGRLCLLIIDTEGYVLHTHNISEYRVEEHKKGRVLHLNPATFEAKRDCVIGAIHLLCTNPNMAVPLKDITEGTNVSVPGRNNTKKRKKIPAGIGKGEVVALSWQGNKLTLTGK